MFYEDYDFFNLKTMSQSEIIFSIKKAEQNHLETQEEYRELEEDYAEECRLLTPNLDILFSNLKNIENYIKMAYKKLTNKSISKMRNLESTNLKSNVTVTVIEQEETEAEVLKFKPLKRLRII